MISPITQTSEQQEEQKEADLSPSFLRAVLPRSSTPIRLVGISGKCCSGKSTLARLLQQMYPHFVEKSFAYRLKQIVASLTGVPIQWTMSEDGKNTLIPAFGRTIGQLLQDVGTDLRNRYNADLWTDLLFQVQQ